MTAQKGRMKETIIDHITKDHEKVSEEIRELAKRVRGRRDTTLEPVFVPMRKELLGHMAAEEELLYPPLEKTMKKQVRDAIREHGAIRRYLDDLSSGGERSEAEWTRLLLLMKQEIEHHVEEEEGEILPAFRALHDEQTLLRLGDEFERLEEEHE